VGKSTLLTKLTGTFSAAASYEFTTLTCIPGSVKYRGSKLQVRACKIICYLVLGMLCVCIHRKRQILDLPGIIEGAKDGKGRGRQVIAVARTCNLILIVLDALKPLTHKMIIEVYGGSARPRSWI
jgi:small GTP-binding protein